MAQVMAHYFSPSQNLCGFGFLPRLAKMFTKQRQLHCNQRLAPISKVHGIFPPQLKPNVHTIFESLLTALCVSWPCNWERLNAMPLHCTKSEPTQSGIRTHPCECFWPGNAFVNDLYAIWVQGQGVTASLLSRNTEFCYQAPRCLLHQNQTCTSRLHWLHATISSVTLLQGELNGLLALKRLTDQFHYFRIMNSCYLCSMIEKKNFSKPTHFYSRLEYHNVNWNRLSKVEHSQQTTLFANTFLNNVDYELVFTIRI